MTTSLDPKWDPEARWEGVVEILPLIDVLFPNDAEARAIAREPDGMAAGERLAGYGPLVVIKMGGEGAAAFQGKRCRRACKTQPAVAIVDAIGPHSSRCPRVYFGTLALSPGPLTLTSRSSSRN